MQHRDIGKLAGAWAHSQYKIGFHGNWLFTIAKCFGFDESAFSYGKTFLWRISSQKETKFQHTAKSLQNRIYCAAVPISNFTLSCFLCIVAKRNKCKYYCYRHPHYKCLFLPLERLCRVWICKYSTWKAGRILPGSCVVKWWIFRPYLTVGQQQTSWNIKLD